MTDDVILNYAGEIDRLSKRVTELEGEVAEREQSFNLRWDADMRASKRWQVVTGKTLTLPDHADLCVWLLGRLERAENEAAGTARDALLLVAAAKRDTKKETVESLALFFETAAAQCRVVDRSEKFRKAGEAAAWAANEIRTTWQE